MTTPSLFQISSTFEHFFQKWTQKGPMPGKGLRNGLRNEQLLLFLAQILVSCSEKRAHEGGCPGASRLRDSSSFGLESVPVFEPFFDDLLSRKIAMFDTNCLQNGTQNEVFWDLLFRESVKMEKCVWTAPACTDCTLAHPSERSR